MARRDQFTFYALASLPTVRGTRLLHYSDTPTRTVTADGTTYRCELAAALGAVVVTKVGRANRLSRAEPAASLKPAAPAGTPTAGRAPDAPVPATAQPVPLPGGVKAVGEPRTRSKPTHP